MVCCQGNRKIKTEEKVQVILCSSQWSLAENCILLKQQQKVVEVSVSETGQGAGWWSQTEVVSRVLFL